jgi:hypothetical protein
MKNKVAISVNSLRNESYIKHVGEVLYLGNHLRYSVKINVFYSEERILASDQLTHLMSYMVESSRGIINPFNHNASPWKKLLHTELNINYLAEPESIKNIEVKKFSNN